MVCKLPQILLILNAIPLGTCEKGKASELPITYIQCVQRGGSRNLLISFQLKGRKAYPGSIFITAIFSLL